ncbi:MAG: glycine cleavage system aminomethyltransferase GcvT [Lentisphaeria bacterium]
MPDKEIKRTCLYDSHVDLGARMAPFGGFEMPIQYSGIVDEHLATRGAAAVFDTCHMGEFRVYGDTAVADIERLISCDIQSLALGRCRYGLLCNDQGGVLDDLLVYRLGENDFMLVVNAGTQKRDFAWIIEHLAGDTHIEDMSDRTGKIDLQGPDAPLIARGLLDNSIDGMVFYSFSENSFGNAPVTVSRTGYTGEVGFEFYAQPGTTQKLWDACLEAGAKPAGLGARDTLRLEMGMPLYGHELNEERNAAQAGFGRAISEAKEFIGCSAFSEAQAREQKLCGVAFPGRRAAREGDEILAADQGGGRIGRITSGSYAPSLEHAVALAYIDLTNAVIGAKVQVKRGRKMLEGQIVELPFYKEGTARKKLSRFLK